MFGRRRKPKLGVPTDYPARYSPELLVSIPRSDARSRLAYRGRFHGLDLWTAYEISWLDPAGKPGVAVGEFRVPCETSYIVESKSLKLYLNSLNQTWFASRGDLVRTLQEDLSAAFGGEIGITLYSVEDYARKGLSTPDGDCLDRLEVECDRYSPDPELLTTADKGRASESLYTHLFKTNCPVTGQPDWASVHIRYCGAPIDRSGLLRYLVSFRQHQDFHEHCVERLFADITMRCAPESLSVFARYTRRGGLDINPYRSSGEENPDQGRLARQ